MNIDKIKTLKLKPDKIFANDNKSDFIKYLNDNNYNCIKRKSKANKYNKFLLIYMASNSENLDAIFKINKFDGNIILFCDRKNNWYHNIMKKIISKIKKYIIKLECSNIILLGQSSGGYASLYISSKIDNCICLAFNPQTFQKINRLNINEKIHYLKEPIHLQDLKKKIIKCNNNSKRYIFTSKSECDSMYNKKGFFWIDSMHAGYMLDAPNTSILIVPKNLHTLFATVDSISLYLIILNNYDILFNNIKDASYILNKKIIYYDSTLW